MLDPGPRYLGLRFDIAGATHYGWARLRVPNADEFTLMDYAYNSVSDEPILAGEGAPTSIARIEHSSVQISPNPFSSTLSVSMSMKTAGVATCTVRALTGQTLLTRTVAPTSGPSSITLDLGSVAPGTYLLEMQTGGERIVRKVVKE
ncbi:MAG: T9SS type A sorting domain-containing protein [Flavobacteriales bacterium]|nr:T9SS type A sorting domain-containing protein [Flavobacteriales bacterium]